METADFHRTIAAYHLAEAAKAEGGDIPSVFDVNNRDTWWPAMKEQFRQATLPHGYVAPGQGVLAEHTGTNEEPPKSYWTHRMLWEAAQRGDPPQAGGLRVRSKDNWGWPDARGEAFRIDDHIPDGPDAIHKAIEHLFYSAVGQAWLASMVAQYPKLAIAPSRW